MYVKIWKRKVKCLSLKPSLNNIFQIIGLLFLFILMDEWWIWKVKKFYFIEKFHLWDIINPFSANVPLL